MCPSRARGARLRCLIFEEVKHLKIAQKKGTHFIYIAQTIEIDAVQVDLGSMQKVRVCYAIMRRQSFVGAFWVGGGLKD